MCLFVLSTFPSLRGRMWNNVYFFSNGMWIFWGMERTQRVHRCYFQTTSSEEIFVMIGERWRVCCLRKFQYAINYNATTWRKHLNAKNVRRQCLSNNVGQKTLRKWRKPISECYSTDVENFSILCWYGMADKIRYDHILLQASLIFWAMSHKHSKYLYCYLIALMKYIKTGTEMIRRPLFAGAALPFARWSRKVWYRILSYLTRNTCFKKI